MMEFRWLKDVQNQKNPTAKYRMEVIRGTGGEADTYKFYDTLTKKPVDQAAVLADAELIESGKDLQPNGAKQDFSTTKNEIVVDFAFNNEGKEKFAEFTTNHVGDILAIVLDGQVISAPNIEEPITEGQVQISGGFKDVRDARMLAQLLNAGALPVPLRPAQTQIVGATLGQDSVTRSINAGRAPLHADLLPPAGSAGGHRPPLLRRAHLRHLQGDGGGAGSAGHHRLHPLRRYGGGRQYPDLRALEGGDEERQDAPCRDRRRLQPGLQLYHRFERDHPDRLLGVVHVRDQPDPGLCPDAGDRCARQSLHGDHRHPDDAAPGGQLPVGPQRAAVRAEYVLALPPLRRGALHRRVRRAKDLLRV